MLSPDQLEIKGTTFHPFEVQQLYGSFLEKTVFLTNLNSVRPGVNQNQLDAVELITTEIAHAEAGNQGAVIGLFGPMAAGKTTVACLLGERLEEEGRSYEVYKHAQDLLRTGSRLVNHTGDVFTEAALYETREDFDSRAEISIIDELQFSKDPGAIKQFLEERRERGLHSIIALLDFNFRREPWKNAEILIPNLDKILVLRARCTSCGQAAEFTQRNINGQPAHVDDQEVIVGAEELYLAMCGKCHQVRSEKEELDQEKFPLAEQIYHFLGEKNLLSDSVEISLPNNRSAILTAFSSPWEEVIGFDLDDEEKIWLWKKCLSGKLDSNLLFFVLVRELGQPEASAKFFSDRETVDLLKELGERHKWGFFLDEVIPDELKRAFFKPLSWKLKS